MTAPFRFRQSHAKILLTECADELRRVLEVGRAPTKAMQGGSLLDYLVSGRDDRYEVVDAVYASGPRAGEPCDDWTSRAARDAAEDARCRGLVPVLPHELDALQPQVERARQRLEELRSGSDWRLDHEVLLWNSDIGTPCQGEPDWAWVRDGMVYTADLKRTASLHPRAVQRQTFAMCWDVQAAAYREAALSWANDLCSHAVYGGHYLLLCEQEGRGRVLARALSAVTMTIGKRRWEAAQRQWLECHRTGEWPGYPEDEIEPTKWLANEWADGASAVDGESDLADIGLEFGESQ